jgi:hypothetical protein
MPRVDGIQQSSPQWLRARIGRVTASRMGDVLAKTRDINKESDRRRKYRGELVRERKDGYAVHHYVTEDMQYGLDHQEDAREAYEIKTGVFL